MVMLRRDHRIGGPTAMIRNDPILGGLFARMRSKVIDQNFIGVVVGQTGSRKSGSAISLSMMLDVDTLGRCRFITQNSLGQLDLSRIVFRAKDFMNLVKQDLPKGSCIVWDEAGVEQDSHNWYQKQAKFLKYIMQTFRYKNWGLWHTLPYLKGLQKSTRLLAHCALDMGDRGIPTDKKINPSLYAEGRFYWLTANRMKDDQPFTKLPRFYITGYDNVNHFGKITKYLIPKPPQIVLDSYEKKKAEVTKNWYKWYDEELEFMDELTAQEREKQKDKPIDLQGYVDIVLQEPMKFYSVKRKKFSNSEIQLGLNCSVTMARRVAGLLNDRVADGKLEL